MSSIEKKPENRIKQSIDKEEFLPFFPEFEQSQRREFKVWTPNFIRERYNLLGEQLPYSTSGDRHIPLSVLQAIRLINGYTLGRLRVPREYTDIKTVRETLRVSFNILLADPLHTFPDKNMNNVQVYHSYIETQMKNGRRYLPTDWRNLRNDTKKILIKKGIDINEVI